MPFDRRARAIFFSTIIIIIGIIHFGVGIGIARRYHKYHGIFEQQVGLSGFNIFIGLFIIIIGVLGLLSILKQLSLLSKGVAVAAFVFGVIAFASLVTALVLSGQAASHFRDSISDNMNDYIQDQDAIEVIDTLQTSYQCCGVNLWLDWSRVQLGVSNGINVGRRRRSDGSSPSSSLLTRAIRRKRQNISPGSIYNLPTSYTINLPQSCCRDGSDTSPGNSLGGYCTYNGNMASSSFYVSGCLEPVCNVGSAQIAGIAVINTCAVMLLFVYFGKMIKLIPKKGSSNSEQSNQSGVYEGQQQQYPYGQYYTNDKQQPYQYDTNQQQQQQQPYPYEQYYTDNSNSNPYYVYSGPTYKTYH